VRVFIALPVSKDVAEGLAKIGAGLKRGFAGISPVKHDGMHFTLAFLGSETPERVEKLKALFSQDDFASGIISARLSGIGTFPERGRPRVIWAGLATGEADVVSYQKRVLTRLVGEGFPEADDGRGFHPHLTIARNKFAEIPRELLSGFGVPVEEFMISSCVLFQSILGAFGSTYVVLAERRFN